jgi:hypothetical protein
VQVNVKPHYPTVRITYITVGNEVGSEAAHSILPTMRNLERALAAAVKVLGSLVGVITVQRAHSILPTMRNLERALAATVKVLGSLVAVITVQRSLC